MGTMTIGEELFIMCANPFRVLGRPNDVAAGIDFASVFRESVRIKFDKIMAIFIPKVG